MRGKQATLALVGILLAVPLTMNGAAEAPQAFKYLETKPMGIIDQYSHILTIEAEEGRMLLASPAWMGAGDVDDASDWEGLLWDLLSGEDVTDPRPEGEGHGAGPLGDYTKADYNILLENDFPITYKIRMTITPDEDYGLFASLRYQRHLTLSHAETGVCPTHEIRQMLDYIMLDEPTINPFNIAERTEEALKDEQDDDAWDSRHVERDREAVEPVVLFFEGAGNTDGVVEFDFEALVASKIVIEAKPVERDDRNLDIYARQTRPYDRYETTDEVCAGVNTALFVADTPLRNSLVEEAINFDGAWPPQPIIFERRVFSTPSDAGEGVSDFVDAVEARLPGPDFPLAS